MTWQLGERKKSYTLYIKIITVFTYIFIPLVCSSNIPYLRSCILTPIWTEFDAMKCMETSKLLDYDELDILSQYDTDTDAGSSGYGSEIDSSDTDCGSKLIQNPDTKGINDHDGDEKMMRYQNIPALCTSCTDLRNILSTPDFCDVMFLVGEQKIPIYGVKCILATRSRVFYDLIVQKQRQNDSKATKKTRKKTSRQMSSRKSHTIIEISHYYPEDFRKIIQFIHYGTVDISVENVVALYLGASEFGLSELETTCWGYIKRSIKSSSITRLIAKTEEYWSHKSFRRLIQKIADYTSSMADEKFHLNCTDTAL